MMSSRYQTSFLWNLSQIVSNICPGLMISAVQGLRRCRHRSVHTQRVSGWIRDPSEDRNREFLRERLWHEDAQSVFAVLANSRQDEQRRRPWKNAVLRAAVFREANDDLQQPAGYGKAARVGSLDRELMIVH
jgi:hypothetical protein